MKKFISLLIVFCLSSMNVSFAFSELYYLKNVQTSVIENFVNNALLAGNYTVTERNPYYAISAQNGNSVVVVLQQSGDNMFYYYQSDNDKNINKTILKDIKKQNIICEQSFNTNIIGIYDNIAQSIISNHGNSKKYNFDDNDTIYTPPAKNNTSANNTILKGFAGILDSGTKIQVYLQNAINTATAEKGDSVTAVLSSDLTYNGIAIAPQGSVLYGTLTKTRHGTYGSMNGRVVINFNKLVTTDNKVYNISTENIDFTVSNEGKITESAKSALQYAAVGAITGLLFALLTDKSVGQSMAVGAGIGAGSSVVYSTAEKGVDAEIPSFTEMEITLTKPLNFSVNY